MPTPTLEVANEVRLIAQSLISQHHTHLAEADILYVFTDQKRKKCDRVKIGSAGKLNALQRFLASGLDGVDQGPDFIILIDSVFWRAASKQQREALVDHELCHCALYVNNHRPAVFVRWTPDMDPPEEFADQRWGVRGHDIEEFGEVLFRHGFWKPDGPERKFGEIVAMQTRMPE